MFSIWARESSSPAAFQSSQQCVRNRASFPHSFAPSIKAPIHQGHSLARARVGDHHDDARVVVEADVGALEPLAVAVGKVGRAAAHLLALAAAALEVARDVADCDDVPAGADCMSSLLL